MLDRVTITGADDNTSIEDMLALSAEFPFVEWGILASEKREGSARYPSRLWVHRLTSSQGKFNENLILSMHLCGSWARSLFAGKELTGNPPCLFDFGRIQINGKPHGDLLDVRSLFVCGSPMDTIGMLRQVIFQTPRSLVFGMKVSAGGCNVGFLVDDSGGNGTIREEWPSPYYQYTGYAGGIGPDNVVDVVHRIQAVCNKPFWIDMEGRVRDEDNRLSMNKVRKVLELCAPMVSVAPDDPPSTP